MKRFPIDQLKIDRAFVRDLTNDPDDSAICVAVIGLAHNLKLTVVAEGVETEGQMNYLRLHNCDEMQGHYYSESLPADAFLKLLKHPRLLALRPIAANSTLKRVESAGPPSAHSRPPQGKL